MSLISQRGPTAAGHRVSMTQTMSNRIGTIVAYGILITASLIVILPLVWVFLTSLKTRSIAYSIPPEWFFTPTSENYAALLTKYPFARYFLNSAFVAFAATFLGLLLSAPAAFSFARFDTGGNFLRGWVLNNRTLPPIVVLIPFFLLAQQFNLQNTYTALIIAYLTFSIPFITWMLISFFESVPVEIEEAARIDGASTWKVLRHVTIPLTAPGIAATGILAFLFAWNEFLFALILTGNETRTLPIAVANFLTQRGVEIGELSAATMTMIVPVVLLTFSIRSYLVRGLSFGGVK